VSLQSVLERLKLVEPRASVNYAAGAIAPMQSRPSYDLSGTYLPSSLFKVPQRQDLQLLRQLRELVPLLDMAIVWLRLLIGEPCIEADEPLKSDIEQFLEGLQVNRVQEGACNWLQTHIDNALLYGRAHAEVLLTNRRDEVFGLVEVAPLTTALHPHPDGYHMDVVQYANLGEPTVLDANRLITTVLDVRGDDPNGTSLLFGIPFIAEIWSKIVRNLGASWDRYGVPSLYVTWKQPENFNDPQGAITNAVMGGVRGQLNTIAVDRANGKTQDLTLAGDFTIGVLGAQGEVMEFPMTSQALMEQICSKTRIPPFIFGLQWATTERMSTSQAILLNEVIESYQAALTPALMKFLTLRQAIVGRPGDFKLSWEHTSLQDRMEEARADWMDAQGTQIDIENQQALTRLGVFTIEEMAQHFRPELEGLTPAEVRSRLPELVAELPEAPAPPPPGAQQGMPPRGPAGPTGEGMRGIEELLGNGNGKH